MKPARARAGEAEEHLHALFEAAFRRSPSLSGPGDDVARLRAGGRWLVAHTDQVVAGVHVPPGCAPEPMARKLLRRTLSDIAAAGAEPWAALWTVAAPSRVGRTWMRRLARAFLAEAQRFEVAVIGGDLSNADCVVLTCTLLGREGRRPAPGRGGARAGDRLLVTGRLGGAVAGGKHLRAQPRLVEGRLLAQRHRAHALMDLSDGLAADLPRLLRRSGAGARVELAALPLQRGLRPGRSGWMHALEDGEDYELLAALTPASARRALADPGLQQAGIHEIGVVTAGRRLTWLAHGKPVRLAAQGWHHRWS
ncbi:MAG: thiamine-phosphate kinase [Planctomycetota bacterium]|nr:MAG: thiamine-phosphate kinase [Planctomycetota bacterium]